MEGVFSYYTAPYLMEKYPMLEAEENIFIASNVIATRDMAHAVEALEPGECLVGDTRAGSRVIIALKGRVEPGAPKGGCLPTRWMQSTMCMTYSFSTDAR